MCYNRRWLVGRTRVVIGLSLAAVFVDAQFMNCGATDHPTSPLLSLSTGTTTIASAYVIIRARTERLSARQMSAAGRCRCCCASAAPKSSSHSCHYSPPSRARPLRRGVCPALVTHGQRVQVLTLNIAARPAARYCKQEERSELHRRTYNASSSATNGGEVVSETRYRATTMQPHVNGQINAPATHTKQSSGKNVMYLQRRAACSPTHGRRRMTQWQKSAVAAIAIGSRGTTIPRRTRREALVRRKPDSGMSPA